VNSVTEFIKTLGPARLAAMGAVAIGLIGFFVFLMLRFSNPQMEVLFTDLDLEDSAEIVNRLEGMNVPHEIRQEGAIILVPEERVARLRMTLAEDGLPSGGTVGYEIFDNRDTLGSTSFVQKINRMRAIEGELARTREKEVRCRLAAQTLLLAELPDPEERRQRHSVDIPRRRGRRCVEIRVGVEPDRPDRLGGRRPRNRADRHRVVAAEHQRRLARRERRFDRFGQLRTDRFRLLEELRCAGSERPRFGVALLGVRGPDVARLDRLDIRRPELVGEPGIPDRRRPHVDAPSVGPVVGRRTDETDCESHVHISHGDYLAVRASNAEVDAAS
jgi:hypothetical protein